MGLLRYDSLSVKLTDQDEALVIFQTAKQLALHIKKAVWALKTDTKGKIYWKKMFLNACMRKIIDHSHMAF